MEDSLAENEDSYIEIELDSSCALGKVAPTTGVSTEDRIDQDDGDGGELKERQESEEYDDELRISISSRIALPDVVVVDDDDDQQSVVDYSEKSVEGSGSGSGPAPRPPLRQIDSADSDEGRRLNVDFWENGSSDHRTHMTPQTTMPLNSCHDLDLHSTTPSRGKEGSMRRRNGGTIMKMLIKFRGIKLSTLISNLLKPPPPCQDQHKNKGHTRKYCRTILQCYHQKKNMVVNPSSGSTQQDRSPSSSSKRSLEDATTSRRLSKPYWDLNNNINNTSSINEGSFRSTKRSSWNRSVVEIDLGALKGMFSAVGITQKGNSSNKRKSCSTISSCDNSPIHEGFSITRTTDNSIQAAIAYCKTSFGQTSDFSF